ncbi:MAG: hypothetical protein ACRC6R_02715 [Bacteroidales bacterium]
MAGVTGTMRGTAVLLTATTTTLLIVTTTTVCGWLFFPKLRTYEGTLCGKHSIIVIANK